MHENRINVKYLMALTKTQQTDCELMYSDCSNLDKHAYFDLTFIMIACFSKDQTGSKLLPLSVKFCTFYVHITSFFFLTVLMKRPGCCLLYKLLIDLCSLPVGKWKET